MIQTLSFLSLLWPRTTTTSTAISLFLFLSPERNAGSFVKRLDHPNISVFPPHPEPRLTWTPPRLRAPSDPDGGRGKKLHDAEEKAVGEPQWGSQMDLVGASLLLRIGHDRERATGVHSSLSVKVDLFSSSAHIFKTLPFPKHRPPSSRPCRQASLVGAARECRDLVFKH
ncbi:hypothetical protein E2C01_055695 [Portunus trituberculatus]|uniref:Uncharacterized protein n=1 Tax=Portunus trituberculatus TaxID=210409 RepID=A0A5B7GNF3_PORTR|nr:hypothetical protein [Portunus trituberculatus]